ADSRTALFAPFVVLGQQAQRLWIERDPSLLAGLRLLLLESALRLGVAALDQEQAAQHVEVLPPDRAQLAASSAGNHRQPELQAPVRVRRPRLGEECCRLGRSRRVRVAL